MMNLKVKIIMSEKETLERKINEFIESDECGQLINIQPLFFPTLSVLITYSPDKPQMFGMPHFEVPEEAENE